MVLSQSFTAALKSVWIFLKSQAALADWRKQPDNTEQKESQKKNKIKIDIYFCLFKYLLYFRWSVALTESIFFPSQLCTSPILAPEE